MAGVLDGIRVIDFSTYLGGAACTMYLGDQGADVIKVEPPEGDQVRRLRTTPFLGNNSMAYMALNRSKRGIVLDLHKPQGKEIALKLAERADVIVEDHVPGVMDGLGLGYEAVRELNPIIIYCSITPFGNKGPVKDFPPSTTIVESILGLMMRLEPGPPRGIRWPIGELPAGHLAAHGIALALLTRAVQGIGQKVETSALAGAYPMLIGTVCWLEQDPVPPPLPPTGWWQYCYYCTKDGVFSMTCQTNRHWQRLCKLVGFEDIMDRPEYSSTALRADYSHELRPLFAAKFMEKTTAEWIQAFTEAGIPVCEVNRWVDLFDHPQVLHANMSVKVNHPVVGETEIPGVCLQLSDNPTGIRSPAPTLGQHTEEVLAELGYTETQVGQLKEAKVI